MKQTLFAAVLLPVVGLIPVSFVSQTASAISIAPLTTQVELAKNDVTQSVNHGKSEVARQVHQATNNGNKGQGNDENNGNGNEDQPIPENRFTANKLRVCEKKEKQITESITRIGDRGAKQLEVFHSIAERTKAFYAAKDYNVAEFATVSQEADTLYDQSLVALNTTQTSGETWSCNGSNPVAQLDAFKQAKEAEMNTLQAYKDKVHELIVLVKSAANTTTTTTEGDNQ
jgi:hypothetical protein